MTEPHIRTERDGDVVTVTMCNPRRGNALTMPMLAELAGIWRDIDDDPAIRCAILTGAGDTYCVGGDLTDGWMVRGRPAEGSGQARPSGAVLLEGLLLTRQLAKPLIAAVNGACLGGGCEMLQATDIRIAEEQATFGLPEVSRGLIPGAGSTMRLKRQIPYTKAMEMILTGDPLTAAEAYHFGLVGHVVPRGRALDKAREIAARVAANGPLAVQRAKASMLATGWLDEDAARGVEQRFAREVIASVDAREGLKAFAEKRTARFIGH